MHDIICNGCRNNKRTGKIYLRPVQAVAGGIAFGRPYSAPFSVR